MSPWLKYQSEAVGDSSIRTSRLRTDSGLRKSASPSRKTRQNAPHTHGSLIFAPANAPLYPRPIFHATCGPVQASSTTPLASSTRPSAISPALPDQIFTVQLESVEEYVSSSTSDFLGWRASPAATFGSASKVESTFSFDRCADAGIGAKGVCTSRP